MHNCNSSINNKSVQKEKVFYAQKCVQHQKQKKAVNALCRSHLHDFLIQRQCGSCSHTPPTWSQEQKQEGKLPQLTPPAPQHEIMKKSDKNSLEAGSSEWGLCCCSTELSSTRVPPVPLLTLCCVVGLPSPVLSHDSPPTHSVSSVLQSI